MLLVCGHISSGSSRQRRATCSTKMSDEKCGLGTAWWTSAESEGSVHSCQTPWMQDTLRATEQTCHCVRPNEMASKTGRVLETHHSGVGHAGQQITISSGICCRFGSGPASFWWKSGVDFRWSWNVLTTWPIHFVLNEAPFLCACEGTKGILTNCVDMARLVGRSRCCKSLVSQRLVQSSLANLFVSHEVCLWNFSIQEDSVHSCDLLGDEEATALPSKED